MKHRTKNLRRLASLCCTAVLFLFLAAVPALAVVPGRPANRYVLDSAGVLSEETEKKIVSANEKLFRETGAEIAVVAVDFLDGEQLEDYVTSLFDDWGLGSSQRSNGLLLVMAIAEDDYMAQAGYGIVDYFSGSKLKGMLDENLEEDFAAGNYDAGALKFFDAAVSEMDSYYRTHTDEYTDRGTAFEGGGKVHRPYDEPGYEESPVSNTSSVVSRILSVLFRILGIVAVVVVFTLVLRLVLGGGRGGRGGGGSGGGGGGFWTGMFVGNMMGNRRRWRAPPPPPMGRPPFGGPGPHPPRGGGFGGGFGGHSGGFTGGGRSGGGGASRGGGFTRGGRSGGGGASRGGGFTRGGRSGGGGARR